MKRLKLEMEKINKQMEELKNRVTSMAEIPGIQGRHERTEKAAGRDGGKGCG